MDPLTEQKPLADYSEPAKEEREGRPAEPAPQGQIAVEHEASVPHTSAASDGDIEEPISVDSNDDDSAVGDLSRISSTTSARASVYDFVQEEDGRTYHRYRQGIIPRKEYMLPNDQIEQDRLDLQHQVFLLTLDDKLNLAPIKKDLHHVLDIGTGTGIWAIDFALEHPSAAVIGSDLSPIQPNFVPVNCTFEVEDFEDEWTYEQKFDLIHGRLLLSCFANPKRVFEQAFAHLAPGGYFEMQDGDFPGISADGSLDGTMLQQWYTNVVAGAATMGRDLGIVRHYKRFMEEAGFVNVEERLFRWPNNTWPRDPHLKKLGFWYQQDLLELMTNLKAPLMRGLGWTSEEVDALVVEAKKDVKNRDIHAYHIIRVVYGMKPL